ncbi:MAG: transcription elongation factor GreA [Actinobacteria bacterium]|uniref:Transcription elongation factor GreA n=1 Tax=freshwater metagenome TaxID=449393 RepID=A0A6J7D8W4_9ZZZZ|nr:transcription elongation factor GreA [Actinomycetota bacterium]
MTTEVTWLTQEGHDRLVEELAEREGPRRQEIVTRISLARDEGDLKENGGYHAAKEEQGKNEARIRVLKHLLEHARIGVPDAAHDEVSHGKVVTVRFPAFDEEETFLLGSREEAVHASIDVYSPTSPLGAAVLNKKVGDTATYSLANGKDVNVEIIKVEAYVH